MILYITRCLCARIELVATRGSPSPRVMLGQEGINFNILMLISG